MPPLSQGGAVIGALSLLQSRPSHRQAVHNLAKRNDWVTLFGSSSTDIWEEAGRLRDIYPLSTNNLVVLLGALGKLEGVFGALRVSVVKHFWLPNHRSRHVLVQSSPLTQFLRYGMLRVEPSLGRMWLRWNL